MVVARVATDGKCNDVIANRGRGQRMPASRNAGSRATAVTDSLRAAESGTRMRRWAFPGYRSRPGRGSRAHRRSWRSCRCRSLRRCWIGGGVTVAVAVVQ